MEKGNGSPARAGNGEQSVVVLETRPEVAGETESRVGFTAAAVDLLRELWRGHVR